jgi:hypothetical protein
MSAAGYMVQISAAPRRRLARLALPVLLLALAGCSRSAYPAPAPRVIPLNEPPAGIQVDQGDVDRIRELERACRVRLRGETANASLAALDRVHEVLGAGCDISTVDHDPLHWLLHCRSDALFESGRYALAAAKQPCPELKNRRVSPWACAGAVFQGLFAREGASALQRMGLGVVGHVDMQPINPGSDSHLCTGLHEAFDYAPSPAWTAVPAEAEEEERQHANNQLAWCRAASVAHEIRRGMERAGGARKKAKLELAVLGLGTSWLRSQPAGACPAHGKPWSERRDCGDARRVDLLVRFVPSSEVSQSVCDREGDDPATALYCLQRCSEQAAVGSHAGSGVAARTAPLFVDGRQSDEALPDGWYLTRSPADSNRAVDLERVCDTLGIAHP